MKKIFITGVDTDIGKTFVSIGLCLSQKTKGLKVGYFKPFQSGAFMENGNLEAPDLFELSKFSKDIPAKYSYLLKGEISPYLASKENNVKIDFEKAKKEIDEFSKPFDLTIIEGAGGLYCPVIKNKTFADFISLLDIPTVIVTTPKLGRLNHTLMTIDCAKKYNIKIQGLIINNISANPTQSELNFLNELKDFTDVKILGQIQQIKNPNKENIIKAFQGINL